MKTPLVIRLLPDKPVLDAATLWGLGRLGRGPGTLGSVAGVLWFTVLAQTIGTTATLVLTAVLLPPAVWLCGEAEMRLRKTDPGEVILDEFVVIPLCFIGLSGVLAQGHAWLVLALGFGLFRLFDIAKPPPIRQLQRLPGGLGIVVDDLAAALVTCACLHGLVWWHPEWFHAITA